MADHDRRVQLVERNEDGTLTKETIKRAMKAYRKSLKVTRLDDESSLGGGDMSSGRQSSIVGIRPPERYPLQVWQELARQNRLVDAGYGTFELGPAG